MCFSWKKSFVVRPSTSPFGLSPLLLAQDMGDWFNSPMPSFSTRSWSNAAALHFPHFNGLEPGKQLRPPYIFIFLGKWVGVSVSISVCSEPKEGKVLPCSLHLLPSSPTLRVQLEWAHDRWLLSLHQRSSPETPAFPRQSGNWTQRLALAYLHV